MLMADMDARLIVQVVINIVNNAIKYTPEGSHITLSAKKSNRRVIAEIADDGPGISDKAKKKLFDMFYTANNKRGDERRGVVSARSDDRDKVAAMDAGADDYAFYADMQKRETLLKMQQRRICAAIGKAYCLRPDVYAKRYAWYISLAPNDQWHPEVGRYPPEVPLHTAGHRGSGSPTPQEASPATDGHPASTPA